MPLPTGMTASVRLLPEVSIAEVSIAGVSIAGVSIAG